MATITKKGKKVYVDDKLIKDSDIKELEDNAALYHEKTGNFMVQKGKFWLWFVDSREWIDKLKAGEYDMLMFPFRRRFDWNSAPINDVWKKSHQKHTRGAEHIIGIVEGFIDEEDKKIIIEMMSVKPGYKMNRINTHMMNIIKDSFKEYKLVFEDPTDDGYLFMKKYAPDAEISWTIKGRPKEYLKDHPEERTQITVTRSENTEA